jgi:hypothetical protein
VSPKRLPATNVEGSTIRRRQRSTYDQEATHSPRPNETKGEEKSNRESIRLETPATPTKHSVALGSNREKTALLNRRNRPVLSGEGRLSPPATAASWPSRPTPWRKKRKQHPPFLFRLKMHAILYLLQVARGFNRTMFRLKQYKQRIEEKINRKEGSYRTGVKTSASRRQPSGSAASVPRLQWPRSARRRPFPAATTRWLEPSSGSGRQSRVGQRNRA